MLKTTLPPDLPDPPETYDLGYFSRLIGLLRQVVFLMNQRRVVIATTLNVSQLPTSATGLRSGDIWQDPSDAHRLKVVP